MQTELDKLDEKQIEEAIQYLEDRRKKLIGETAAEGMLGPNPFVGISGRGFLDTTKLMAEMVIKNPKNYLKHQIEFLDKSAKAVFGQTGPIEKMLDKKDRRFIDPSWKENAFYRTWLKIYFSLKDELEQWIEAENLSEADEQRVKFIVSLIVEGIAPSNSLLNPAALKRFIETGGLSTIRGFRNFVEDMVTNAGMPSQVDKSGFKVGENLATTEGSVVFKNELIELIQYKPLTPKVNKRPLLVIPPQINKFYVFDLSKHNSVLKYVLQNNVQAFMVSWRNPTPEQRDWGLGDYLLSLNEAINVTLDVTRCKDLNIMAACSGGVTLTSLLGYYAAKKINKVKSATLLVSLYDMDTTIDTPLGLFADEKNIESARKRSAKKGVLKGSELARVFSWMRPNDLIWNYWVNNYLIGNSPPAFDILYWNADSTNLPAALHSDLLDLFKNNSLVTKGGLVLRDVPIDLGKIACDVYSVAGLNDHICNWKGCYRSSRYLGEGKTEFVLSSNGHIQSILNLPGNPKSRYFINSDYGQDPEKWFDGAEKQEGSWWPHWIQWFQERAGEMKTAPKKLGNKKYPALYAAPGENVL